MIRGGLVTLFVRDVARATRFYVETLGMKLVAESAASSVLDAGEGFRISLTASTYAGSSPALGLGTKVPLEEAIAIYENRGIAFEPKLEEGTTRAYFRDPDGNSLYLLADAPSDAAG